MWLQAPLLDEGPLIIPTPKHVTLSTGQVHVNESTRIVCGSPRMTREAAEAVQREVVRLGGPKLPIQTSLPANLDNTILIAGSPAIGRRCGRCSVGSISTRHRIAKAT